MATQHSNDSDYDRLGEALERATTLVGLLIENDTEAPVAALTMLKRELETADEAYMGLQQPNAPAAEPSAGDDAMRQTSVEDFPSWLDAETAFIEAHDALAAVGDLLTCAGREPSLHDATPSRLGNLVEREARNLRRAFYFVLEHCEGRGSRQRGGAS